MLRIFGSGLPSDAIAHRFGFEGNEPDETAPFYKRFADLGVRSAFSVNTFYEEIEGGYYCNRALFGLIDEAMRTSGVFPVVLDIWRAKGLVPIEGIGQFAVPDEYALVTSDQSRVGVFQTWQFHAGGGAKFYADNVIFELILPEAISLQIVTEVERRCSEASVRFTRAPAATSKPTT